MRCLPTIFMAAAVLGAGVAPADDQPAPPDREPARARALTEEGERGKPGRAEAQKGAFLGVATSPPTPVVREQLKLPRGMGLVVDVVEKGSPAAQAGLKQYDVLTKLGDQLLVNPEQLAVLVRNKRPGDEVELTVVRGGAPTTLKAKLVERELPPLDDILFFRGAPGAGHGREWEDLHVFQQLPPEVRDWWARHPRNAGDPPPASAPGGDPKGAPVAARSVTTWTDGEHVLTVTTDADRPGRQLIAKDKGGTVIYEGDLDADGARDALPDAIKAKLRKMEEAGVKPPKPAGAGAAKP
jgi:hypothetical protein